jgi:hypothetical protein
MNISDFGVPAGRNATEKEITSVSNISTEMKEI